MTVSDTTGDDRDIVLTAGAVLRGDDGAGPVLSKLMEETPIAGWRAIDGGQTPEDDVATIRRCHPRRLVVVDAAAMGLPVGSVRRLTADDVSTNYLMTTHSLPLTFMLRELEGMCDELTFLGIQPATTEFFDPLTPAVMDAVRSVYAWVAAGADPDAIPAIEGADAAARERASGSRRDTSI